MKFIRGLAALALVASAVTAHAEITGTITGTTDYDFRGVTQSAENPAIQGSLDFAADNGFYAGIWASNVDWGHGDPNVEVDWYAGWGGGEDITWDVGILYYTYINAGSSNYPEMYAGVGWKWFEAKAWYSWDYAGIDGTAEQYYEGNFTYELPANFGLTAHAGYSAGSGIKAAFGQGSYMDWSAGLTYSFKHFDLALKWVDGSDLKTLDNNPYNLPELKDNVFNSEARAIFSISTTFPWKDE